jgi:hypothetical protein
MKNKLILGVLMVLLTISCRDNSLLPVDFHSGQNLNGAYLRTISIPSYKVNPADMANTSYEIIYEAGVVDITKFQSVVLTVQFKDHTAADGTYKRSAKPLATLDASKWTVDATSKLPRYDYKVSGAELLAASTIPADSVFAGDAFEIVETINYDGQAYSFTNTSADLTGGPFYASPFLHNVKTGDDLSISMTWDDGKGYCKSIDLDLYLTDATQDPNNGEVDAYAAATGACPESTTLVITESDGSYYGLINPYTYTVTATDIAPTFTFSKPGKTDVKVNLVDGSGNPILIKTTDHVWSDKKKDNNFVTYTAFKVVKTGASYDVYDGSGAKVGTFTP